MKIKAFLYNMIEILVSAYMIAIIGIMPFYFQEGYNHIGSDKSYFFRTVSTYAAKLLLPLLALYVLCLLLCRRKENRGRAGNAFGIFADWLDRELSCTDVFALFYAVSVLLSYTASRYRDTALWGEEGWYMGMLPQLFLVGIYFLVSRFWGKKWIGYLFLPISAAVFLLGICNRFGFYPFPMENADRPDFISTIGNINWYCGYLTAVFFLGAGIFWAGKREKGYQRILLPLYTGLGFMTLVTQGSDSGLFALAVVLLLLFWISAGEKADGQEKPEVLYRFWEMMLIFAAACTAVLILRLLFPGRMDYVSAAGDLLTYSFLPVGLLFISAGVLFLLRRGANIKKGLKIAAVAACFAAVGAGVAFAGMIFWNTRHPGVFGRLSELDILTFGPAWGSNRGATWTAGIRCFREQDMLHKLLGVGPDCMWDYISRNGSESLFGMVQETFGAYHRLTNAHCEWLNVLVNTGVMGSVGYVGMIVSAVFRYLKRRKDMPPVFACGLCLLAYSVNNLWSFQQSMSAATLFVILGMGERQCREKRLAAPVILCYNAGIPKVETEELIQ